MKYTPVTVACEMLGQRLDNLPAFCLLSAGVIKVHQHAWRFVKNGYPGPTLVCPSPLRLTQQEENSINDRVSNAGTELLPPDQIFWGT